LKYGFIYSFFTDEVDNKYDTVILAQTEGDTGYDYNDAYEDEFYDESGAFISC